MKNAVLRLFNVVILRFIEIIYTYRIKWYIAFIVLHHFFFFTLRFYFSPRLNLITDELVFNHSTLFFTIILRDTV